MDHRDLRRLSRRFWLRHRPIWEHIRQNDPGFWVDLWDTMQEAEEMRWTRRGAVVVNLPRMRDAATQHRPETRDAAVGTRRADVREMGVQAVEAGAEVAQQGCWNCRSLLHTYSDCTEPRRWPFCFGCGTRNVTVRSCPRCGPHYRRTRPYRDPWAPGDDQDRGDEGWPWEERAPRRRE